MPSTLSVLSANAARAQQDITPAEDGRDFGRYNGVFKEYFPDRRIARTTVEARAVVSTKIEIDCIAYKPL